MSVITISRELGSQGTLVATKVAQALGYAVADKNTLETIFKDYGLPELEEEYGTLPTFWDWLDFQRHDRRQTLFAMLNRSICALAQHGNVIIVGRGGFAVLAGLADVLNVRIQAPWTVRIQRAETLATPGKPGQPELMLKENDHIQKVFVKTVYGREWDSASNFDLVINTGQIDVNLAAELIVRVAHTLPEQGTCSLRTTASLTVDRTLAYAVEEALNPELVHA